MTTEVNEESLSDASLIEDEEDDEPLPPHPAQPAKAQGTLDDRNSPDGSFVIDLPGEPVTAPVEPSENMEADEEMEVDEPEQDALGPAPVEVGEVEEPEPPFHGWTDEETMECLRTFDDNETLHLNSVDPFESLNAIKAKIVPPKALQSKKRGHSLPLSGPKGSPKPTAMGKRESREWRPSAMLFKPLETGWIREVIYKQHNDGRYNMTTSPAVIYHAPLVPGTKARKFKSISELQNYLSLTDPTLTRLNFSFRPEPMGAASSQEVIRGVNEHVDIHPHHVTSVGPKKTPKSKPGLFSSASVGAKPKLPNPLFKNEAFGHGPTTSSGLKLKTFSKMHEKNSLEAPEADPGAGGTSAFGDLNQSKTILQPTHSELVSCSIHCPGVQGFPSLSCSQCQSMFHPTCVGLSDEVDFQSNFDFFCISCKPLPGKENSNPFSTFSSKRGKLAFGSGHRPTLPKGLSITPTSKKSGIKYSNGVASRQRPLKARARARPKDPANRRLIESQTVVNIAGIKYLVVPHLPDQGQQPPGSQRGQNSALRLPLLLRPSKDAPDQMPSFEVEEAADGKLLLVPMSGSLIKGDNPFAKKIKKSFASSNLQNFNNDLSSAYSAMLHVFRYLSLQERMAASQVCKLWRDLAFHPSLWRSVCLKNVLVTDWGLFVDFLNKCRVQRLDLRRMLHSSTPEDTWNVMEQEFPGLNHISEVIFPKSSMTDVAKVASAIPCLEKIWATSLTPREVDVGLLSHLQGIHELCLKTLPTKMKLVNGLNLGPSFVPTLTKVSILGLELVTPSLLQAVTHIQNLEALELGHCTASPPSLFQDLSTLTKLKSLRLESVLIGKNLEDLRWLSYLEKLELIDVQLQEGFGEGLVRIQALKKLLLIPHYTEEVASVNAEIVDSVMAMPKLSHFFLGLTIEWLKSMSSLLEMGKTSSSAPTKDSFPILKSGVCELFSLSKLFKTLTAAMPQCRVKILKMKKTSTNKQFIDTLIK